MVKKLIVLALATVMILGAFALSGCAPIMIVYADYEGDYGKYKPLELVMKAGETHTITANHFQGLDIDFDRFEFIDNSRNNPSMFNPNAITMSDNIITAQSNGFVNVYAYLYEKEVVLRVKKAWCILVAQIQVINIAEMTEITTAQELQDMSLDPSGNFILKADIDLAGLDWEPVHLNKGSFINPDSFVISNLTIKSLNVNSQFLGLFGGIYGAYIDGILLEKVNIDYTTILFNPSLDPRIKLLTVGGIAGDATESFIVNCKVEGRIKTQQRAGGIVGKMNFGIIKNCGFNGTVIADYQKEADSIATVCAGGIVGFASLISVITSYLATGIFDSNVKAEVISAGFAGGIVGSYQADPKLVKGCVFIGTTQGERGSGEYFGYSEY